METITDAYLAFLSHLRNEGAVQEFHKKRVAAIEVAPQEPDIVVLLDKEELNVTLIQKTVTGKINHKVFKYEKTEK